MKSKLLGDGRQKTWALVFDTGDSVVSELESFARENHLCSAHFTAIGAFSEATLYFFDWESKRARPRR